MFAKPTISPSANGIPLAAETPAPRLARAAFLCVGALVVLAGTADLFSRAAHAAFPADAATVAFAPAAALAEGLTPIHLDIPAIGVHANVEQVGKKDDDSMGTPRDFANVGWYLFGVKPGQAGNAVFDGHVNNALTKAGVFEHLGSLKEGDYITVSDVSGKTLVYRVSASVVYGADSAPLDTIFSHDGPSQLVLITCDGEWIQTKHSFDKRLVVFATLQHQ